MSTNFKSLHLIEPLLMALYEEGYTTPTPIQAQSIPIVLAGKDLLGCAQTGTGKTAAFTLPIIQLLLQNSHGEKRKKIRSLIVTPTRELAIQIAESFNAYGRHTPLNCTVIFGGVAQGPQVTALRNGVDVVIATPGRLLDLMNQGHISLREVEIFVLDEADRMLDMGFVNDVKKLLAVLPKKRQSLFFSATMPAEIVSLASTILFHPEKVTVTPVSSTVEIIEQSVYFVDKNNKNALLIDVLKNTGEPITFTLAGPDADAFELDGSKIVAKHTFDYENKRAYEIILIASYGDFNTTAKFSIVVKNVLDSAIDAYNENIQGSPLKEYNFQEKVRSLNLNDFKSMFKQSKIEILHIFGDYKLNDFDINNSKR